MPYDPSRFNMTVTLRLSKNTERVNPSVFDEFVSKQVGEENVELLRPFTLPNEWELELKSEAVREKLLRMGKTKVEKWTCWIFPFCTLEVRGYLHWLPNAISNDTVKEFLSQYGEVVFVENHTPQNWDSTIANESRYYALYLNKRFRRSDIPHFKKFGDFLCWITVRGRRPACFHCRAWGHKKSQCKLRQINFNNYCRKPHSSGNVNLNEQGNSNVIASEVETTFDASSSTTTELVNQQVCLESESSVAYNSTTMADSTSGVCINSEASTSSSFITLASFSSQVCTENELSTGSSFITVVNDSSQFCLQNEPSTSNTSIVCFEKEQSAAANFTMDTTEMCSKSKPSTSPNSTAETTEMCFESKPSAAPNSTIVTTERCSESKSSAAPNFTIVTTEMCSETKPSAASICNTTTLNTSEVCAENEVNAEFGCITTADSTSQICIENVNNSNTKNETIGASRICSDWMSSDEDFELEKQIFLAIHYLGKWKMAIDKLIENAMNTEALS